MTTATNDFDPVSYARIEAKLQAGREKLAAARLAAAAPDLLAALREALPYINDDPNYPDGPIARAVAAIAKAEGK